MYIQYYTVCYIIVYNVSVYSNIVIQFLYIMGFALYRICEDFTQGGRGPVR